ncbi:carbohydrate ABC transporter permease [Oscillospiraceae bacterium PP1C4]
MNSAKQQNNLLKAILSILICCFGLITLLPTIWMVIVAVKPYETNASDLQELFQVPFTFENFVKITSTSKIWRWIFNSFFISCIQTAVGIFLASLAAFGLSVIDFKGKKLAYFLILAGLMIPVEALIMPAYSLMIDLGWINTYKGLIIPGLAIPLAVIIFKQFYDGIPRDLIEASNIDGANILWVWWRIFLPLSRNTTATISIFLFIQSWNNFLWPMLVGTESDLMTLTVALPVFQSTFSTDMTMPMTANLFASLPAILVFLIFQKQIEKGIAMTGIK